MPTMAKAKPIQSATLTLTLESASHVIGLDDQYIVFPAIDFTQKTKPHKKPKPLTKNLNKDKKGPRVVQVTVQQLGKDDVRRGYYGHAGIERLTLLLPLDTIEDWVKQLALIRSQGSLALGASVDELGDIVRLTFNDEPVTLPVSSETRQVGDKPSGKTGTD
jgi:hypothetical protein